MEFGGKGDGGGRTAKSSEKTDVDEHLLLREGLEDFRIRNREDLFKNGPKKKRGVSFGLQEREGWEGGEGNFSP